MIHPHSVLFNILELKSTSQEAFTPVTEQQQEYGTCPSEPSQGSFSYPLSVMAVETHDCISCCKEDSQDFSHQQGSGNIAEEGRVEGI